MSRKSLKERVRFLEYEVEGLEDAVRELRETVIPDLEDEIGLYLDMAEKAENEKLPYSIPVPYTYYVPVYPHYHYYPPCGTAAIGSRAGMPSGSTAACGT